MLKQEVFSKDMLHIQCVLCLEYFRDPLVSEGTVWGKLIVGSTKTGGPGLSHL